jgi:ubiquinone/menaquinone biosynthesis C-methylase UbiE
MIWSADDRAVASSIAINSDTMPNENNYENSAVANTLLTVEQSYRAHERSYEEYPALRTELARIQQGSVDTWRHDRMRAQVKPVLDSYPDAKWLTVGDGRYGLDAHFLEQNGADVTATDIADGLLAQAKEAGIIKRFQKENAEMLSFASDAFDFAYCKESCHHFPQPMKALYEMLRVAKTAAILIEPQDFQIPHGFIPTLSRLAKDLLKRALGRENKGHEFEKVGNFVYKISRREIEKVALGSGFPTAAFKGINDYYMDGVGDEAPVPSSPIFQAVSKKISRYDTLCRFGLSQHGLLCAIIFKQAPSQKCRDALTKADFFVVDLPSNPWLKTPRAG